jgi:hypothetical protein
MKKFHLDGRVILADLVDNTGTIKTIKPDGTVGEVKMRNGVACSIF